jgi:nucleoside 2-deoxyribosyltransferase
MDDSPAAKKIVYLASPYGFSAQQKAALLPAFCRVLEDMGAEVWEPFARNNQVDFSAPGWAWKVGQADLDDVRRCDAVFAIVNGTPPDEGVMVELGAAIAWGKPTFLFRDDFRRCTDSGEYPLNLMLFTGLPRESWREYYYTALDEIAAPDKALFRWLRGVS